ncbi:radical SAM protein [Chryseotalea sanaruensis]|uniref:Radical SAM protein n=1 Tax=Chryseotalea sanaruensis TaxID=2482724 RepID=A0A401UE99_9BACT|nr:radical SAM protein [Chryseotalea sanaruensis]GCC53235.1 radical SAM protein [Chryseotalea sanaruensis]
MKLKSSFYNEIIPIEETNEFLIYNIVSGGLNVLNKETGLVFSKLKDGRSFELSDFPSITEELSELFNNGFIVEYEIDEIKKYRTDYIENQSRKYRTNGHIGLTIGTTILCNMGCPYCFEDVKPNKTLRDERVLDGIVSFIEGMIQSAPVEKWSSLSISWYGGEPLINKTAIEYLSEKFISLSDKYSIPYDATIITNGIYLDADTWQMLKKYKVSSLQVTIDGAKEVHDVYRPLKNSRSKNYEKILENISMMPEDMDLTIRINTDKRVAATFERLLDDLQSYGIWPQRHKSFSLSLAWLRSYPGADSSTMQYLTKDEFFDVQNSFSKLKVSRFNSWAETNSDLNAKMLWMLPDKQSDCATYVSPYFFTFDPEGTIHKCWETIHDTKKSSGTNVFKSWSTEDFEKYLNYSRTNVHPICETCKFNPVCGGLSCAYDALADIKEDKLPCTIWKTKLPEYFKDMYLMKLENPDKVSFKVAKVNEHQTHSNK